MSTLKSETKQISNIGFTLPLPEADDRADSCAWHERDRYVRPLPPSFGYIFKQNDVTDGEAFHRSPWDLVEKLEKTQVVPTAELKHKLGSIRRIDDAIRDYLHGRIPKEHHYELLDLLTSDSQLCAAAIQTQLNESTELTTATRRRDWFI